MTLLLFALAPVWAADEANYDRLFGTGEATAPAAQAAGPQELPSGWRLVGPGALGALGLVGAWWLKKGRPGQAPGKITLLGRQALGDRASLVLVEVEEPDGERRRLLVGTGGQAPTLVADLGSSTPNVVEQVLAERAQRAGESFGRTEGSAKDVGRGYGRRA